MKTKRKKKKNPPQFRPGSLLHVEAGGLRAFLAEQNWINAANQFSKAQAQATHQQHALAHMRMLENRMIFDPKKRKKASWLKRTWRRITSFLR